MEHTTTLITSTPALVTLTAALDAGVRAALDTETVVLRDEAGQMLDLNLHGPGPARVVAVAVEDAAGTIETFVVDVAAVDAAALASVLNGRRFAGWNAAFDEVVLAKLGITVDWFDAMLAEALLNLGASGRSWYLALDVAARRYLGRGLSGKGGVQLSYTVDGPLDDDQVAYAAADVAVTLTLAGVISREIAEAGLTKVCRIDLAARPVIAQMTSTGFVFDSHTWQTQLDEARNGIRDALATLAALSGESGPAPTWNPRSDVQLRDAMNAHAAETVTAAFGRLLEPGDSLDKAALQRLGGPFAEAVLALRSADKLVSTYGDGFDQWIKDGRVRSRYLLDVTATGRLASRDPAVQNLAPGMKPAIVPGPERIFAYADLSQAELRAWAHLSGDTGMLAAFADGADFHTRTASAMFGVDMDELKQSDPDRCKALRSRAKALSFGQVYGMSARGLALSLTDQGVPTTADEAKGLLERFAAAFPQGAGWLADRDGQVRRFVSQRPRADWETTMQLAALRSATETLRKRLKKSTGSWPTGIELAAAHLGEGADDQTASQLANQLDRAYHFDAGVVLDMSGAPIGFESRTAYGRRRLFQVAVDTSGTERFAGVLNQAVLEVLARNELASVVAAFAVEHSLELTQLKFRSSGVERAKALRAFDGTNRHLRWSLLEAVRTNAGDKAWAQVLDRSLDQVLRGYTNAFRNHPIQGLVADVVLDALAELGTTLPASAKVVMSVHDSITVEADVADGPAALVALEAALAGAMARACPTVKVVADADLRRSADDSDVVTLSIV
jgi:DNA polymerase I-like protein with 3'-5' exonuclease and polymerase domains